MQNKTESERKAAARLTEQMGTEITREMVRWWKIKGYPLDDVEELKRRLKNQQRAPKPAGEPPKENTVPDGPPLDPNQIEAELAKLQRELLACGNYEDARTINTKIVGIRAVLKELREQGKYILREAAAAAGMKAGLASRGAWERIEDELPPMLDGLTAAQMKAKLRDYGRMKNIELSEIFS